MGETLWPATERKGINKQKLHFSLICFYAQKGGD